MTKDLALTFFQNTKQYPTSNQKIKIIQIC